MDILINVLGQKLKVVTNLKVLVAESQQFIRFKFNLEDEWDPLTTFVQFGQAGHAYNVYLDTECSAYLPSEIVPGKMTMVLYGTGGDVRGTTNYLTFDVEDYILVRDAESTEISQSLYDQMINRVTQYREETMGAIEDLEDLITQIQNQLPLKADQVDLEAEVARATAAEQANANAIALKANQSDFLVDHAELIDIRRGYDGTQYDTAGNAVRAQANQLVSLINNRYTKTETDDLLDLKADKATTYTKTETDALIREKTSLIGARNFIINGAFNSNLDNWENWQNTNYGGAPTTREIITDDFRKNWLHLVIQSGNRYCGVAQRMHRPSDPFNIRVEPGKTYTVSFRARGAVGGETVSVAFHWFVGESTARQSQTAESFTLTDKEEYYQTTVTVPIIGDVECDHFYIMVGRWPAVDAQEEFWITDIQMERGETRSSWREADEVTAQSYGLSALLDMFYPIGTIYKTSSLTYDPNESMGGLWRRMSKVDDVHVIGTTVFDLTSADVQNGSHAMHTLTQVRNWFSEYHNITLPDTTSEDIGWNLHADYNNGDSVNSIHVEGSTYKNDGWFYVVFTTNALVGKCRINYDYSYKIDRYTWERVA